MSAHRDADRVDGLISVALADQVRLILSQELGVDVRSDSEQMNSDLRADSMDMIEIELRLEEAFDIDIPERAIDEHSTVAHVIAVVERLLAAKVGA
jgi:acyl carrier protein